MNKQVNEYLDELCNLTYAADCHYQIWWTYKEDRPKYVGVMNEYFEFFRPSISAHFTTMLVALCNLYENRNDTKNLKELVRLIENDLSFDRVKVEKIKNLLLKESDLITKIMILRSNHFTHINKDSKYEETIDEIKFDENDPKKLIQLSYEILNELGANYFPPKDLSAKDTKQLLNKLAKEVI